MAVSGTSRIDFYIDDREEPYLSSADGMSMTSRYSVQLIMLQGFYYGSSTRIGEHGEIMTYDGTAVPRKIRIAYDGTCYLADLTADMINAAKSAMSIKINANITLHVRQLHRWGGDTAEISGLMLFPFRK